LIFRTPELCTHEMIDEAHESLLFQNRADELSTIHVNFMKAIVKEEQQPSSKHSIETYQLGTSANVIIIKKALIKKEIIDVQHSSYLFLDPLYEYWLRHYYFRQIPVTCPSTV